MMSLLRPTKRIRRPLRVFVRQRYGSTKRVNRDGALSPDRFWELLLVALAEMNPDSERATANPPNRSP